MHAPKPRSFFRRMLKLFVYLIYAGSCLIAVLFATLWFEHRTVLVLPPPSGPFSAGRAIYDWTDNQRLDPLAPQPGTKSELLVWIWYPAPARSPTRTSEYLPSEIRIPVEHDLGILLGKFLTHDLSRVRTHALLNAPAATDQSPYPVVVFRAGASAEVWTYSTLAEDLASRGYVVVGFDAPYRSFDVGFSDGRVFRRLPRNNPELCLGRPDEETCVNRIVSAWTSDIGFVVDRLQALNATDPSQKFAGRLDLTRLAVIGHSLGGAEALQFCHDDPRCKAGIDIDGAPQGTSVADGVRQPFMILLSDHSREQDSQNGQIMANLRSIYNRLPVNARQMLFIRGANHFTFSDDGALLKSDLVRALFRRTRRLGISGPRQLAITSYCIANFLDRQLKRKDVPPVQSSSAYPEIVVLN